MRKLRMWYGLVIIWTSRYAKTVVRKVGELMKVYGRKLEHLGDNITPKWSRELFQKCYLADAEITIGSNIFAGRIDSIHQEHSGKDSVLVVRFKKVIRKQIFQQRDDVSENNEFKLPGYGHPVVIKEAGCDCVWTSFNNGYLAIFFR
ncbi:MAG: hypothetical protein WAV98_04040 [Minisyncoccia bacterium]